jgi:small subunit ribosomal protein S27Ae
MAEKKKEKKKVAPYKPGRICPKCGKRMAEHQNRFSCGNCTYTEFKSNK